MNYMSMDSIIEVFCHLNKMLIATKHIADNNFCPSVKQRTGTSCMQRRTKFHKPHNFTFSDLWPQQPRCDWWTPL